LLPDAASATARVVGDKVDRHLHVYLTGAKPINIVLD
jgi:hypothetical protein